MNEMIVQGPPGGPTSFAFDGHPVRVVVREGEPWFVLTDVCKVLQHSNPSVAAARLDDDEKGVATVYTLGGDQQVTVINESGLYSLVLTSRKAEAKAFKRWVTHEVLPAIRKTGGYMVAPPEETPEELALRALTVLQATVELQKAKLADVAPKAAALDRIATHSDGAMCITDAAKHLQVRPKDLFDFLRAEGWIYRRAGGKAWLAYQPKLAAGLLEHKVTTVTTSDGNEKMAERVLVTAKGLTRLARDLGKGPEAMH